MADVGGIAAERLRAFVERIERLEEEKAALAADIREVYGEAKANGFDVKTLRRVRCRATAASNRPARAGRRRRTHTRQVHNSM